MACYVLPDLALNLYLTLTLSGIDTLTAVQCDMHMLIHTTRLPCCPVLCAPTWLQMLSACSNPSSVMRQQAAFDQQDSRVLGVVGRQLGGKGGAAGTGVQAGVNKPRKRWMALF